MPGKVRMSEKEAIARGLIPNPKTQFTTSPPTDSPLVFDRDQYKREQSIPKLSSTPKPLPQPQPAPVPRTVAGRRSNGEGASTAFALFMAAVAGWLLGFVCGLRMGQ